MNFENEIKKLNVSSYNQFNWFRVMYKMTEEENLHSRFISFLLDPKGTHKQGTKFLELFFKEINIEDFSMEGITVNPNERQRSEIDNIDILITNSQNQAIIIENKIFAKDSNKDLILESEIGNCTHKYQIPRYYNKTICKGYTVTHIFYLTVMFNKPSCYDEFPQVVKDVLHFVDYIKTILDWIGKCIELYEIEDTFKVGLKQYKQATTEFLNDYKLALQLKDISGKNTNINEAFKFWNADNSSRDIELQVIKEQFIHVKWHTVHEFYSELANGIQDVFSVKVNEVDKEKITTLTHHRNSKSLTGITFEYNGQFYYVCNDKNGFSIGRDTDPKTKDDFKVLFMNNLYSYFDFSRREVFDLVNDKYRNELVSKIIGELKVFMNSYN